MHDLSFWQTISSLEDTTTHTYRYRIIPLCYRLREYKEHHCLALRLRNIYLTF